MNKKIKTHLNDLASQHNITILHACETGSRAWGFASTDSDYDVRVIYMHHHDWYLSLNEQKDNLNLMLNNDVVDISGWDLRKSLRLLAKSNAPLIERIQSPIIYQQDDEFIADITALAKSCYSRISTIHHYHGMAKKPTLTLPILIKAAVSISSNVCFMPYERLASVGGFYKMIPRRRLNLHRLIKTPIYLPTWSLVLRH